MCGAWQWNQQRGRQNGVLWILTPYFLNLLLKGVIICFFCFVLFCCGFFGFVLFFLVISTPKVGLELTTTQDQESHILLTEPARCPWLLTLNNSFLCYLPIPGTLTNSQLSPVLNFYNTLITRLPLPVHSSPTVTHAVQKSECIAAHPSKVPLCLQPKVQKSSAIITLLLSTSVSCLPLVSGALRPSRVSSPAILNYFHW